MVLLLKSNFHSGHVLIQFLEPLLDGGRWVFFPTSGANGVRNTTPFVVFEFLLDLSLEAEQALLLYI